MGELLPVEPVGGGTVTWDAMVTHELQVDPKLLSHEAHLPETIECMCGYVRPTS